MARRRPLGGAFFGPGSGEALPAGLTAGTKRSPVWIAKRFLRAGTIGVKRFPFGSPTKRFGLKLRISRGAFSAGSLDREKRFVIRHLLEGKRFVPATQLFSEPGPKRFGRGKRFALALQIPNEALHRGRYRSASPRPPGYFQNWIWRFRLREALLGLDSEALRSRTTDFS